MELKLQDADYRGKKFLSGPCIL